MVLGDQVGRWKSWLRTHGDTLVVGIGLLTLVVVLYHNVLLDPSGFVFSVAGDGPKNYFTFARYIQFDGVFWNDPGFNYPYGESLVYADAQPWLAWLLGQLPLTGAQAIGVMNVVVLMGLVFHGIFLHRVLLALGARGWFAVMMAWSAALMTPQVFRIAGHLALAHAWILSLGWWLSIRAAADPRWLRIGISGCAVLLAYFTHPYLGLMLSLLLGAHAFLGAIADRRWCRWVPFVMQALAPTLLFFGLLRAFDAHTDRPQVPMIAPGGPQSLAGLFDPIERTLLKPLTDVWDSRTEVAWESWCYLGAGTIVLLALIAGVHVARGFGWRRDAAKGVDAPGLWLLAASVPLCFALGLPEVLSDMLPVLKQFRSPSRFAWVFHMVLSVFVLVRLHAYKHEAHGLRRHAIGALLFLACGANIIDGFTQQHRVAEWCTGHPNPFKRSRLDAATDAMVKAAQAHHPVAVLPLPFAHNGAEVYDRLGDERVMAVLYPIAYHCASSVLAGITSRTSLEEARRHLGLLGPLQYTKAIKADLRMGDTVLVVCAPDALDADERRLWDRCHPIASSATIQLAWITTDELVACDGNDYLGWFRQVIEPFVQRPELSWSMAPDQAPRLLTRWADGVVEWPEGTTAADTAYALFLPKVLGPVEAKVSDTWRLYDLMPTELDSTKEYELGLTFREIDGSTRNMPVIWEHTNTTGRDGVWEKLWDMRRMPMQWNDRTFATMRFIPKGGRRNSFLFSGRPWVNLRYAVDHIYLRRADVHYWRIENTPAGRLIVRDNVPLNPAVPNERAMRGN